MKFPSERFTWRLLFLSYAPVLLLTCGGWLGASAEQHYQEMSAWLRCLVWVSAFLQLLGTVLRYVQ